LRALSVRFAFAVVEGALGLRVERSCFALLLGVDMVNPHVSRTQPQLTAGASCFSACAFSARRADMAHKVALRRRITLSSAD
jgi:hypothetical protein